MTACSIGCTCPIGCSRASPARTDRNSVICNRNCIASIDDRPHNDDGDFQFGGLMRALRRMICLIPGIAVLAFGSLALAEGSSRPYANGGPIGAPAIIQRYNKSGEL